MLRADPVRAGLLFVGTETGVFVSRNDGENWQRMRGGLPVAPVYDLKLKGSDLVAATHGRSFWILDDISPLRKLQDERTAVQLVAPRDTVRTKLSWSSGTGYSKRGISYSPAFGIGAGTEAVPRADGGVTRRHLDVGENPPNGAIVYYWLPESFAGTVSLTFKDAQDQALNRFASEGADTPLPKRPGVKPGLNRFVWDLRQRGPSKLDPTLVVRRNKPFAEENDDVPGPSVAPGRYRVVLEAGGAALEAEFALLKDPRIKTTQQEFDEQAALLRALYAKLSSLNDAVNKVRRIKQQLVELQARVGKGGADSKAPSDGDKALAERCKALVASLESIETVLVDVKRESPRDILRHPAGLNDTLVDLIGVVAIADEAPTAPARQVSMEIMDKVDAEIAKLDALLAGEVAGLNAALRGAGVELLGAAGA